jgi:ribonuclease HI
MNAETTAAGYPVQLFVATRGQSDGPGGYGVVLLSGQHRKVLSGGFVRTTVPRLELYALAAGLRTLKRVSALTIVCQSDYAAAGLNGQALTWQAQGWRRGDDTIPNADLWVQLLPLLQHYHPFQAYRSAARPTPEAVREAQQLAALAAHRGDLPPDDGFAPALMPTMF